MPNFDVETNLKDGTPVIIRLVDPCTKECIQQGFDRLSQQSRLRRFHSPISKLTDAQAQYLATTDNVDHVAIGAHDVSDRDKKGIGIARYIRLHDEPDVAEFAMTVVDAYQGRGLGKRLLDLLIQHAKENRIRVLRGYVMKGNAPMIRLLQQLGADSTEEGTTTLRFDLEVTS